MVASPGLIERPTISSLEAVAPASMSERCVAVVSLSMVFRMRACQRGGQVARKAPHGSRPRSRGQAVGRAAETSQTLMPALSTECGRARGRGNIMTGSRPAGSGEGNRWTLPARGIGTSNIATRRAMAGQAEADTRTSTRTPTSTAEGERSARESRFRGGCWSRAAGHRRKGRVRKRSSALEHATRRDRGHQAAAWSRHRPVHPLNRAMLRRSPRMMWTTHGTQMTK